MLAMLSLGLEDLQPPSQIEGVLHPVSESTSTLAKLGESRGAVVEVPYFLGINTSVPVGCRTANIIPVPYWDGSLALALQWRYNGYRPDWFNSGLGSGSRPMNPHLLGTVPACDHREEA